MSRKEGLSGAQVGIYKARAAERRANGRESYSEKKTEPPPWVYGFTHACTHTNKGNAHTFAIK